MPDSFPEMIRKINEARASNSGPNGVRDNRLSNGGRDAAAVRASLRQGYGSASSDSSGAPSHRRRGMVQTSAPEWSPSSWTSKPIKQDVVYEDKKAVESSLSKLERLPPIVTPAEIVKLKSRLKDVALGKAFLLQGGDCAELFDYCSEKNIDSKMNLLLQMSLVLVWGANKPVVRVARLAGQYAKPRSKPTEVVDGKTVPAFRGDILNGYDLSARIPDPERLVSAYFHSTATLNYLRAQLASGAADLHHPWDWRLGYVKDQGLLAKYQRTVDHITESLRFMKTVGADTSRNLESVELYTSHEGLLLEYEQSLTRKLRHPPGYEPPFDLSASTSSNEVNDELAVDDDDDVSERTKSVSEQGARGWYNTSAHFLWIGDRTRQIDGAHVEYFRGLENPIGIKVGPSMASGELVELLDIVNPAKEVGKVTLITRYGESKIDEMLGSHVEAVRRSGHVVVWQCDPMHGNTHTTTTGIKTRHFSSILSEVSSALRIHAEHNSFLGGVHLELTGEAVTECVGGSEGLVEEDLNLNYTTYCDPRLNEKQALELAFLVADNIRQREDEKSGRR